MLRDSAEWVLRVGLAFAFLYPAINAIFDPFTWIGYFPAFTRGYVDDMVLLHTFGAIEAVIAVWLLWGRYVFWPSLAALGILLGIIVFDFSEFQIIFRDVSIAAIALYLCIRHYPYRAAQPIT